MVIIPLDPPARPPSPGLLVQLRRLSTQIGTRRRRTMVHGSSETAHTDSLALRTEGSHESVTSTPMLPSWLVGLSAAGGENFLRLGAREKAARAAVPVRVPRFCVPSGRSQKCIKPSFTASRVALLSNAREQPSHAQPRVMIHHPRAALRAPTWPRSRGALAP